ncbi:MAG: MmcQ/YjbR family DNA-binding protein [Oscillospiraceae bacterium]|jgi:predicted DNA-binding protein (MmcQ/YjbR family)|nr:MmcQ/YjbR family DNA-binding protein [Oscillospiraceae bacterium]
MTKRELIDYCLTLPMAYEDYPFEPVGAAMRHTGNKKIFAYISESERGLKLVYKAHPTKIQFWRDQFEAVKPAFHWNKEYWNEVYVNEVEFDSARLMILDSYDLIKPKLKRRNTTSPAP